MPLKEFDAIQLREEIKGTLGNKQAIDTADRKRTPDRDKVAQYIQSEVIEQGRWPMNMTDLAEETEYSRQLVSEVVQDYFEGVDRDPMPTNKDNPMTASPNMTDQHDSVADGAPESFFVLIDGHYREIEIDVPDDVENRTEYIRGYLDGRQA